MEDVMILASRTGWVGVAVGWTWRQEENSGSLSATGIKGRDSVAGEHFSVHDRKADLHMVDPTGVNRQVNQSSPAVDRLKSIHVFGSIDSLGSIGVVHPIGLISLKQ